MSNFSSGFSVPENTVEPVQWKGKMLKVLALLPFSGLDDGSNSNVYLLVLFQEQLLIDTRTGTFKSLYMYGFSIVSGNV